MKRKQQTANDTLSIEPYPCCLARHSKIRKTDRSGKHRLIRHLTGEREPPYAAHTCIIWPSIGELRRPAITVFLRAREPGGVVASGVATPRPSGPATPMYSVPERRRLLFLFFGQRRWATFLWRNPLLARCAPGFCSWFCWLRRDAVLLPFFSGGLAYKNFFLNKAALGRTIFLLEVESK